MPPLSAGDEGASASCWRLMWWLRIRARTGKQDPDPLAPVIMTGTEATWQQKNGDKLLPETVCLGARVTCQ